MNRRGFFGAVAGAVVAARPGVGAQHVTRAIGNGYQEHIYVRCAALDCYRLVGVGGGETLGVRYCPHHGGETR